MKKQVAAVVSFSALLTLSAFAPKVFWHDKTDAGRFPASEEAITPPKKSLYERRELDMKKEEVKKVDEQISCLKDQQPSALEEEIKKLMADKEAIMKEIEELKAKKDEPKEHEKKVSKKEDKEDFVSLVSQMTSLMISQQQQQTMLMQQMFTMMNQMQQAPQMSQLQQNLMNPYAYDMHAKNNFSYPQAFQMQPMSEFGSEFGRLGQQVGMSYQSQPQSQGYQNPYALQPQEQMRVPSSQEGFAFPQTDNMNIQSAVQKQMPVGNMSMFNPIFGGMTESSANWQDMQRVTF